MEEYDVESILDMYEDDYVPERIGFNKGLGAKKINRDESYRKVVKDFVATSGPGTGKIFDDPAAIEIVKANLNKIKKQRNNKALFEWSEDSDWYRKLRKELNPNTKTGTNREYTNKLINQVVDEFFPGAYHGKNAIKNFRNDMVVKSFIQHLKSVGEFDGQEKFDKVLDQFTYKKDGKRKSPDHLYEDINRSWKSWIAGEFEVDGIDRAELKKELKARGIDYSQIDNWKAAQTQKRGTEKIAEIKFLDNQNSKFPKRSLEQVEELFKKKFPNGNFYLRVNNLTEIKRNGVYVSGATSERSITGIDKGDRADWLKKAYGKQFAGNYSKIINAADQLAAAGETAKAQRLYNAADKFFGPNGIVRKSAVGEAEHALARSFDFLNPDRQLAINSIVSGDLNQFKKNLFDIPVKRYFDEYNNSDTTKARKSELKNLIEERKKVMNALTGGQKSGIVAGDIVNFRYGPNEITATSNVKPIDTLFKQGKFNIDDYIERGNKYTEAFETATKDINIKKDFSTPMNKDKLDRLMLDLAGKVTDKCNIGNAEGGRIGFQSGRNYCLNVGKQALEKGLKNGFPKNQQVLAEGILKAGRSLKDIASLRGLLGPAAIAFTAAAEAGLVGYDMLSSGKSFKEAVGGSLFNYMLGDKTKIDLDEEIIKRLRNIPGAPSQGFREFTEEDIGKMQAFKSGLMEISDLNELYGKIDNITDRKEDERGGATKDLFSPNAFQLDKEEDLLRGQLQDFYRSGGQQRLENVDYGEGAKQLLRGNLLAEQDQLYDAGIGKFYQSPKGDEKRISRLNDIRYQLDKIQNPTQYDEFGEYFMSRPPSEQSYLMSLGYSEGGIATLKKKKKTNTQKIASVYNNPGFKYWAVPPKKGPASKGLKVPPKQVKKV